MSLDRIANEKPYLKEVIELYGRVREFDGIRLVHDYDLIAEQHSHYIEEDIETVFSEFSRIFEISPEKLAPLKEAMAAGEVDFMVLPEAGALNEGGDGTSEAPSVIYLLSRPFFRSITNSIDTDSIRWEEGRCPVCNSVPSVSIIEPNEMRKYCCTFCSTVGHYGRTGCPNCQSDNHEDMETMVIEDVEGVRLDVCNACNTYYKAIDAGRLLEYDAMEHDIISLPIDIVAQGKGFERRSPNPVGITRIS